MEAEEPFAGVGATLAAAKQKTEKRSEVRAGKGFGHAAQQLFGLLPVHSIEKAVPFGEGRLERADPGAGKFT